MNSCRSAHTAASVLSRRVNTSGAVRPRTDRWRGAAAITAAGSRPNSGHRALRTRPATATTMYRVLTGSESHQRTAKLPVDPGR